MVADDWNIGVLLVEHKVDLVTSISDTITVLDSVGCLPPEHPGRWSHRKPSLMPTSEARPRIEQTKDEVAEGRWERRMTDREANPPRVGFVGLGDMGGRIARRIAMAGYPLTVFDMREDAMAEVVAGRGRRPRTMSPGLAAASDVVCICVVDDEQVRSVVAQLAPRDGLVVLIHSSVLPETVRDIAADIGPAGALVVDAPVSGSRPGGRTTARSPHLSAAKSKVVDSLRPLLASYCANVIHAGQLGSGRC